MNRNTEFIRSNRAKRGANHRFKRLVILGESLDEDNRFSQVLSSNELKLEKSRIEILQVNLGKLCNLTCHHCHVEAGPDRTEMMTSEMMDMVVSAVEKLHVSTVDLTGGAPEMFPGFKSLVRRIRSLGAEVIIRSNLTILVSPGYEDFIDFFVKQKVRIIASLPCYTEENVDEQRGDGVFQDSIKALKLLNRAGFGVEGSGLGLDLVYNPGGPSLPGPQASLEKAYKEQLLANFDIVFNSLIAITNLPIGRFFSDLKKEGKDKQYEKLLEDNFNPQTVNKLMCKNTVSVSWDGWLYDCDFNQMLELPLAREGKPAHIGDPLVLEKLKEGWIPVGNHCFGCTAGAGSSCGGELLDSNH